MSQKPKHVCFYSKKCPYSKAFLEELSKTQYSAEFKFMCVDPGPNRPRLPAWLKGVPTLVIDGETDPLTDEKVFNWLSLRRIQSPSPGSSMKNQQYKEPPKEQLSSRNEIVGGGGGYNAPVYDPAPPPRSNAGRNSNSAPPVAPSEEEPLGWHSAEMAGTGKWSDGYSFLEDEFSIEKGVGRSRIERNFEVIGNEPVPGSSGPAAVATKESEKARALNSAFDDFRKQRDQDLPGPPARR